MRQHSTPAREMTPPILVTLCPGGGGHLWARLNKRWSSDSRARPKDIMWCPDHYEERAEHVRQRNAEAHRLMLLEYQQQPVPATRSCLCKNPETHAVGAVLPSGKFYRRTSRHGTESLESQCKDCRRAQAQAHRDSLSKEELRRRARAADERHLAKKRKARKKLKNQRSRRVPLDPFRQWLLEQEDSALQRLTNDDRSLANKIIEERDDRAGIQVETVDRMALSMGQPGLVTLLYARELVGAADAG